MNQRRAQWQLVRGRMILQRMAVCLTFLWLAAAPLPAQEASPVTNLRLAGDFSRLSGNWLVLPVSESQQGEDLNGDGDTEDRVIHVHNLETGETVNLGLAEEPDDFPSLSGNWLVLLVSESQQGEDLNGDGDTEDRVIHVHNLETGETVNLRLAGSFFSLSGNWLLLWVSELSQGEDLNGDGDLRGEVPHVHNLETGVNDVQNPRNCDAVPRRPRPKASLIPTPPTPPQRHR